MAMTEDGKLVAIGADATRGRVLLVLDNVDDPEAEEWLAPFVPRCAHVHVLHAASAAERLALCIAVVHLLLPAASSTSAAAAAPAAHLARHACRAAR